MTRVYDAFAEAADRWSALPFLAVLPETASAYGIEPGEISYEQAALSIDELTGRYAEAGYGPGHRVGLRLGNRPAFLLHWLALNRLGASIVPINPDLRSAELDYLVGHSAMCLVVADRPDGFSGVAVIGADHAPPQAPPGAGSGDECALLYTSGTTGLPKGCVLSNAYFLGCGQWYLDMGGLCVLHPGQDRMLTPLPLFHMNALAVSTMAMIMSGGCLIVLDRFHPATWWASVAESGATIVHYLGVMPALLLAGPAHLRERAHKVRFGFGAGADRRLHGEAEARWGFPLVEGWAMTETGAAATIQANREPRHVGTNCFGRPEPYAQVRVVADDGSDAPHGTPGELLVRAAGPDPRAGFFSEYLKDPEATAAAWAGGWFHTGDLVRQDADATLYFVDRKKNVIRRSGENISAVEVEGVLLQHPHVRAVAVAAVPDALRGDEVFACVVAEGTAPEPAALVAWCLERLAYYKAPGWVAFADALPLTGTNKIQRGAMKSLVERLLPNATDTRALKRRS